MVLKHYARFPAVYARGLVNISMACVISGDPREALRHVMCIASVWIANCDAYIRDLCQLMALNRNNTGLLETSKVKLATAQLKEVVQRGTVKNGVKISLHPCRATANGIKFTLKHAVKTAVKNLNNSKL